MTQPNILLTVIDCARADRFSCHGYPKRTTPHVDAIAERGVRFEAAYSESTWTVPAAFTLLTGLAPREHQAEVHRQLPAGIPTVAEALKQAGYTTLCAATNRYVGPQTGLDRGFDWCFAPRHWPAIDSVPRRLGWADKGGGAAVSALLRRLRATASPWFALLWVFDVHWPYFARRPFATHFCPGPVPFGFGFGLRRIYDFGAGASPGELATVGGLYDGCLAYDDMLVGRLRDGLHAAGQWDDSVVIVTADHGEMLGEKGELGHGPVLDIGEPLLRIPLVVHAPRLLAAPGTSQALVQLADVAHTIAGLAGVGDALAPTAAETVDLITAARGEGRPRIIAERFALDPVSARRIQQRQPRFDLAPNLCDMTAVVEDGWKLIHRTSGRHDLYDLAADPTEERNLIGQGTDGEARLSQVVYDWTREAGPHPSVADRLDDPESAVKRRLEDLGYFA